MTETAACQLLEWDTAFFGARVARVNRSRVTREEFRDILEWCARERVECLYLLADATDATTGRDAESNGFHLTDVRVTLERELGKGELPPVRSAPAGGVIRRVTEQDVAPLVAIARQSHTDSRFYHDPRFSRERCDELYGVWIEKACRGGASAVFVAELHGEPVGYITCDIASDTGSIGLIGLGAAARGLGFGSLLVQQSLAYFQSQELQGATVVTQGRNAIAQRLYQRAGFLHQSIGLWYHRWF